MSLAGATVRATVAVSDIDAATAFYEGKLGLAPMGGGPEFVRIYACGDGLLQVYASPEHAGKATSTVASWSAEDFDGVVDGLITAGVQPERYDTQDSDERGVHTFGEHRVIWLTDPDGNVLAVDNARSAGM